EGAAEPEQGGEEDRHPEQAARLQPRRRAGQGEMEDHEDGGDEEEHRRQRVPRPQLEQEILPGERAHVADVAHVASASEPLANGATRPGSWVESRKVRSPRSSASWASSSSAPASSSALYGSSSTSSSGSWSRTRQSARRCVMPREYE